MSQTDEAGLKELVRRRWDGTFTVDAWGLDRDLVNLTAPLFGLRWSVSVTGGEHLPAEGPAVVVFNQRFGLSEPMVVPRGVRLATGRHLRVAGVIDVAPTGTALRRLGGILADPDEVAGLLRAGEVVGLGLGREPFSGRSGDLEPDLLAPALDAGVPVLPCLARGQELGRRWRLSISPPVAVSAGRRDGSPADVLEAVQAELSRLRTPRRSRSARRTGPSRSDVIELVR